ncbi:MAG: hypothetical protein R3E84_12750 [Pseudomonadales bacterium]
MQPERGPIFAWFDVRGDAQDDRLLGYVRPGGWLSAATPRQPNRYTREAGYAFWLEPDPVVAGAPRAASVAVETPACGRRPATGRKRCHQRALLPFHRCRGLAERVLRSGTPV